MLTDRIDWSEIWTNRMKRHSEMNGGTDCEGGGQYRAITDDQRSKLKDYLSQVVEKNVESGRCAINH